MLRPLSLYIGLRYTRAKKRSHFVSFISAASMIGIALGVMVLITVLSVMNGFNYQIQHRFFALAPQVTVFTRSDLSESWPRFANTISAIKGISGVAPYVSGQGMVVQGSQLNGLEVMGILPKQESKVSQLAKHIVKGSLLSLQPGKFNIVIGNTLATKLGVGVGDKVIVYTPRASVTLAGMFPYYRRFTISGIFQANAAFGFGNMVAYVNMQDAHALFPGDAGMNGFHVRLDDLFNAPLISSKLAMILPSQFFITNWTIQAGAFFHALKMEKTMLFTILLLIVAIAAFNLVSTLVMVVNDKRADIAILRTLGASPGTIMRTILVQGAVVGLIGTLLGLGAGLLLAYYVTPITNWIQHLFHVQFVKSSVYFINYLPSRIELSDVIHVCVIAFVLSIVATLYPAWLAFKTQPAEALRYE